LDVAKNIGIIYEYRKYPFKPIRWERLGGRGGAEKGGRGRNKYIHRKPLPPALIKITYSDIN
jgi:hypothetical protein